MQTDKFFHRFRFGLQTKVVFITVLTGALLGGLLTSFQFYQNRTKAVEIAKDRLRHDGEIIQQEITERGEVASEISKKIAITLQLFDKLDSKTLQQVVASFQKKNPGFRIQIRSREGFFTGNPGGEKFSNPNERQTIFSALNGESTVSIEHSSGNQLAISSASSLVHKSKEWIIHTEWTLTPEFLTQVRRFTDRDIAISFLAFKNGESISSLIEEETSKDRLDPFLNYATSSVENPFFTKETASKPSKLSYYLPLLNSRHLVLGAVLIQLEKSVIFLNKEFFQFGAFILFFPFLMGILIYLLIKYMITAPIIQLSRVAKTIAVGNFSVALPQSHSNDEIGGLTAALSEMKQKIENKTTELTSLNDALLSQKKHLMKLNHELNEKNDYIATLVSTVSHELRTPMSSIMGFAELLLNRKFSHDKQAKYLETIHLESKRLATILNDFLDLQKLESREPGLLFEEIDCIELIETVLVRFPTSIYRQHKFSKKVSPDLPFIKGDKKRLLQVLINLVSNAIKYSPEGGTVTLEVRQDDKEVLLSVKDEGIGIPLEKQDKVFTRFFRVDSSDHREIGGTGLGLSICKEIILLHGGRIWVESKEQEGTCFTFSIPLSQTAKISSQT